MRIFITGGTGFVGRCVVPLLLKRGHRVLLLSRSPRIFRDLFPKNKKLQYVKGELFDSDAWFSRVRRFKPDVALHMAWEGIPDYSAKISARNLIGSVKLFLLLTEIGCKKILGTGTCWEYGVPAGKLSEFMPAKSINPVSAAKNAIRAFGEYLARENGASFAWLRLFFVYGPGQRRGALLPLLLAARQRGEPFALAAPFAGNDFIYVEDAARAIVKMIEKKKWPEQALYNVGAGKLVSNQRVANIVYGMRLRREPRRPKGFYADISKIRRELGWKPHVGIEEGIRKTMAFRAAPQTQK